MKRLDIRKANTAIDTFALNTVDLATPIAEKDSNMFFIKGKVSKLQINLNTAIKRDKVYSGLDEADAARDDVLKKIDATLNGLAAIPVAEISEAAAKILPVWKKYGMAIVGEAYEKESSLIESFYSDVVKMEAEIKALPGFQTLLDDLRAKEDDFKAKTNAFLKNKAEGAKSATEIKKELVTFINSCLLPYTEAMLFINPELYQSFAAELEVRITRTNA